MVGLNQVCRHRLHNAQVRLSDLRVVIAKPLPKALPVGRIVLSNPFSGELQNEKFCQFLDGGMTQGEGPGLMICSKQDI